MSPTLALLVCGLLVFVIISPNRISVSGCPNELPACADYLCDSPLPPNQYETCDFLCYSDGYASGVCSQDKQDAYLTQTCTCSGTGPLADWPYYISPNPNTPVLLAACNRLCQTVCTSCAYHTTNAYCDQFSSGGTAGIHCYCPSCPD